MRAPLVCTPLRLEQAALRRVLPGVQVARTGMGSRPQLQTHDRLGQRPVLVAGVGGALTDAIRPGDVVVATEVRGGAETVTCPSARSLAGALRRLGLRVHLGPILSTPGIVGESARAGLARTGALAVDMESAQLAVNGDPFATFRVIVDTPAYPLLRPGTVLRGLQALRTLRATAPAIQQWLDELVVDRVTDDIRFALPKEVI